MNGFIGQLSVQAADFSILVIAVVTLLTITRTTYLPAASTARKCLICGSVWVVPLITATVATAMGKMGPVSGNWCWILKNSTDLRYALTHGWRIAIIFCTAAIYIFVWWYMNRHFRSMVSTMTAGSTSMASKESWYRKRRGFKKMKDGELRNREEEDTELSTMSKSRISRVGGVDDWELSAPEAAHVRSSAELFDTRFADTKKDDTHVNATRRSRSNSRSGSEGSEDEDNNYNSNDEEAARRRHNDQRRIDIDISAASQPNQTTFNTSAAPPTPKSYFEPGSSHETTASEFPKRRQTRKMEREIKRMLLLNAYPIMYVILWIPGLVNRFMEATGNTPSNKRALAALQASSQFVGLANAITYGFNTALRKRVRRWWMSKRKTTTAAAGVRRTSSKASDGKGKRGGQRARDGALQT